MNTTNFHPYAVIAKKRDGGELSKEEIQWFVRGVTSGAMPEYQASALLMAMFIRGMSGKETQYLTDAMLYSGKVLDFKDRTVIDKHSTGGVGDKTSFILAPIAAACGVRVPMIAGRGLGHTGGTVDKIEAVAGFNTSLSLDEFSRLLYQNGLVMIGQTADIAPADKKIYALRDVTGTVENISLITASIMSKKLAEGASGIVMDVKVGPGAFMKTLKDARGLAKSIAGTAIRFNKSIMTMISDMSQPLGKAVGNSLEIIESVETLKGNGPKDLTELSVALAGGMVYLAGLAKSHKDGIAKAEEALRSGKALQKFRDLISAQGGNPSFIDNYQLLPHCQETLEVLAINNGHIHAIDGMAIGLACVDLGGGRKAAGDKIDFAPGFIVHKRIGEVVKKGESLLTIHFHPHQRSLAEKIAMDFNARVFVVKKDKPRKKIPLVYEIQTSLAKKK